MQLTYYRAPERNFGDDLNEFMWQRLLPADFLDDDPSEMFFGIGSILFDTYPLSAKKYIFGSGYAGYTAAPNLHDGTWEPIFVRGPRTAKLLNLSPEKAVCDSAILLRSLVLPKPPQLFEVSFMPHFQSLERGNWTKACDLAGIHMIDPTGPVEQVLNEIAGSKLLITEAMHGAIVGDALRVPWVAVLPIHSAHHMKWLDWAESLNLSLAPLKLRSSTVQEAFLRATGRGNVKGIAGKVGNMSIMSPANAALTHFAAAQLQRLAKAEPMLSKDEDISRVTEKAFAAVNHFVARRRSVSHI